MSVYDDDFTDDDGWSPRLSEPTDAEVEARLDELRGDLDDPDSALSQALAGLTKIINQENDR